MALLCALALLGAAACDGDDDSGDRALERRERRALERERPDGPEGEALDRLRAAAERDGTARHRPK